MKKIIFLFFLLFIYMLGKAAIVDTVNIFSNAMNKDFKCVVIKPDTYKNQKNKFPVVYLLHGYGGWYSNWIIRVPELKNYADDYQMIIVCPEGGYSSWYLDSPIDSTMRYETYVAEEVPEYIDKHYNTIKDRKARAITGLSMGGHGGIFIGFRHAGYFGACGSMSGLMDLKLTTQRYDLMKRLGDTIQYADSWRKYSIIYLAKDYPKDSIAIIIDCGIEDPFLEANRRLHQNMLTLKIPHDYIERPGKHDWAYWANAVRFQLLFFRNYFDKMKTGQK